MINIQPNKLASERTRRVILQYGPSFEIVDNNETQGEPEFLLKSTRNDGFFGWLPKCEILVIDN